MASPIQQLNAMRLLSANWDGYGAAVPEGPVIELAGEFVGLIEALLRNRAVDAAIVHVSPTRIGGVLIEWEDAATHHEVDISPDQSFGFLHLNKATRQIETRKLLPGDRGEDHLLVTVLGCTSNDSRYADAPNLFRYAWRERAARK